MAKKTSYEMHVADYMTALRAYVGRTKYGKGCYGEKLTEALLLKKAKQYPEWYYRTKCKTPGYKHMSNYEYLKAFCGSGWFIADCCGLIKGIRAGYRADGTKGNMTTEIDQTIEQMADSLTDKTDAREVPEGGMIYFDDYKHVATISEPGAKDIESSPTLDGAKEVSIDYQPRFKGAKGGKLPWIDYRPRREKLVEDGIWGMKTTRAAQEEFGTPVDGIVSRQLPRFKSRCPGCGSGWQWTGNSGDIGSALIRAMQKWLKVEADGHFGTKTIEALQRKMGTPVDGVLSRPSPCIKAFQHYLNERIK